QGSTPRFVFDQHDAAPVLLEEKFPQTPLRRPLMTTARRIERWSFAAAGLVVFANAEYRARAERDGLLRSDSEVGTNGEQDNVDRLVDAVAELGLPGRVKVVVAGAGSALAAAQRRARDRDVAAAFEWLGFVRDRDRIASLVRSADVCVAPEVDSAFNRLATFVKVVEYMSAGAPTVAHRLPQTER